MHFGLPLLTFGFQSLTVQSNELVKTIPDSYKIIQKHINFFENLLSFIWGKQNMYLMWSCWIVADA